MFNLQAACGPGFVRPSLGFCCNIRSLYTDLVVLILLILNLIFLIKVIFSATSSCLCCILGDFHVSTDMLVKLISSFMISALVPLALNFLVKSHTL